MYDHQSACRVLPSEPFQWMSVPYDVWSTELTVSHTRTDSRKVCIGVNLETPSTRIRVEVTTTSLMSGRVGFVHIFTNLQRYSQSFTETGFEGSRVVTDWGRVLGICLVVDFLFTDRVVPRRSWFQIFQSQ